MAFGLFVAFDDLLFRNLIKPTLGLGTLQYLIGCPVGLWIIRKLILPSVEVAG